MTEAKPVVPRPRIEGLSDLIFGLALSIGAIQLMGNTPQTHAQLVAALGAFGFSFLILINVWNRYTMVVSVVPVETTMMVRLNTLLLFLVAVEPYLFNLLVVQNIASTAPLAQEVSAYYGLDLGGMNLVLAYFAHILTKEEKLRKDRPISPELVNRFKRTRNAIFLVGLIFALSAIPAFWSVVVVPNLPLRFLLWILTVPVILFSRAFGYRL